MLTFTVIIIHIKPLIFQIRKVDTFFEYLVRLEVTREHILNSWNILITDHLFVIYISIISLFLLIFTLPNSTPACTIPTVMFSFINFTKITPMVNA